MAALLDNKDRQNQMQKLHSDWQCQNDKQLYLEIKTRNFAAAYHYVHLAAFISEQIDHHADIAFGWGYCQIRITTHDAGGLTALDFDFAKRFDMARAST